MSGSTHAADMSKDGARIDMTRAAMQQALEALLLCDSKDASKSMSAIAALRAALAEQAQPVAWVEQIIDDLHALHDTEMIQEIDSGDALIRLDDAIAVVEEARDRLTTPPAPVVPPGWKLVPVEPTQALLDEAWKSMQGNISAGVTWAAMLAAAPEAPTPVVPQPLTSAKDRPGAIYVEGYGFVDERAVRAVEAEVLRRMGVQR